MSWTRTQKLGVFSAVSGAVIYYYYRNESGKTVFNSWTTNTHVSNGAKWDVNWDHRDPKSIVKPLKNTSSPSDENKYNEKLESVISRSVRHLILIRHGQYHVEGKNDTERILTEVGRKQAAFTGERLKSLKIDWDEMIRSTMARAQETGKIIGTSLPNVPVENCSLLEEGAPCAPEPPIGHWRPEPQFIKIFKQQFFTDGARIEAAFRKYFHRADATQLKDSYTLIVCHANVIRYFTCRALQLPPEAWLRLSLNHASITWISIHPSGRVVLRCFGDSGFIPTQYVTSR